MPTGVYKRTEKHRVINKGRKHTIETKQKMSASMKGKMPKNINMIAGWNRGIKMFWYNSKTQGFKKGNKPWNKNKAWSSEIKKKLSISHIGIQKGDKHPNWRGGKSFEDYGKEFNKDLKNEVREKFGYLCQLCGTTEIKEKQHSHHIDYDKKNNDIDNNFLPLCRSCHLGTNINRRYWTKLFKDYLEEINNELTECIGINLFQEYSPNIC